MRLPMFNLFAEDAHGKPVWLGAVADLNTAHLRLMQLASVNPGEYFILDLCIKQIVGSVQSISEEVRRTREHEF
jgi:hypothetical protein